MRPCDGPVSQPWGGNKQFSWQPWGHLGIDIAVAIGTDCRALADGTVMWANWSQYLPADLAQRYMQVHGSPASGIVVIIQHDGWLSMYCHLSETHLYSKSLTHKASTVKRGQVVSKSGNTGNSTGPHVHFETFLAPASGNAPFSRYNPELQIAHEDRVAAAAKPTIKPNQRYNGNYGAIQRRAAHGEAAEAGRVIAAGKLEEFIGYVIGSPVTIDGKTSNVWYVDRDDKNALRYVAAALFVSQAITGLPNLTPPSVHPGTRKSGGAAVAYRTTPFLLGNNVDRFLPANTTFVFDAWTEGDEYNGSKVWFRGRENKFWAHSSLFTSQSTDGLTKIKAARPTRPVTPAPELALNQRVTTVKGLQRTMPARDSDGRNIVREIMAGTLENFTHWTRGEKITSNGYTSDIWYGDSIGWVWEGGFTSQGTAGLTEAATPYMFTPDFPIVTRPVPAAWANFQVGNFPARPTHLLIHQFDDPEKNPTLAGVDSWFKTMRPENPSSAQFACQAPDFHQYVKVGDRAQHAGPIGNAYLAVEVPPNPDDATIEMVREFQRQFHRVNGYWLILGLHKDTPGNNTSCGIHIPLERFRVDTTPPADDPAKILRDFTAFIPKQIDVFLSGQR